MILSGLCFIFTSGCYLMVLGYKECYWSTKTVESVPTCPVTITEFEERKEKKNCERWANVQNCTDPLNFLYHCVINEYGNATVEVCSPKYKINGYCTEYNTVGARIQPNLNLACSEVTPPCDKRYDSTDSYLYEGCFALLKKTPSISNNMPNTKRSRFTLENGAVLAGAMLLIVIIIVAVILGRKARQRSNTAHNKPNEHMDQEQGTGLIEESLNPADSNKESSSRWCRKCCFQGQAKVPDSILMEPVSELELFKYCKCLDEVIPRIYQLPPEVVGVAREEIEDMTELVPAKAIPVQTNGNEKTIMIIGKEGSGKKTMIDSIINYIMRVEFGSTFRFTIFAEEERRDNNQAVLDTQGKTVYKVHPIVGSRINYTFNIIDTSGVIDTGHVDEIHHIFSLLKAQGILYIDAICFIVKANQDVRKMHDIIESFASICGKNVESNSCVLTTFADLAVNIPLQKEKSHFCQTFNFFNSALFTKRKDSELYSQFWEMGEESFDSFFNFISKLKTTVKTREESLSERSVLYNN